MLVEGSHEEADRLREVLASERDFEHQLDHFLTLGDALIGIQNWPPDIVLLDLNLPDVQGLSTVQRMTNAAPKMPIVIIAGPRDERIAVEMVGAGVQDFLVKGQIAAKLLVRAVRYAIERKRAQVELARKNAELTALNEQKNQLLGMAAHDLRNPLSVISNYCEFLLADHGASLSPDQQRFVATIKRSSESMLHLITDLLNVSALDSGKVRLDLAETRLDELVEQNVELHRVVAEQKGVQLKLERQAELPAIVLDRAKIEQVLDNLISNAIKYSAPGTQSTVTVGRDNGSVVIAVSDQGSGIPAWELGGLFQPFGRTSVRASRGEPSTGLGLAIVKRIIDGHHGTIRVESKVGQGSVFRVTLPVMAPAASPA
jgi:signal transduction histidine kinase